MQTNWKKTFITIYTGQAFSILGSAAVQFAIIWWLTVYTESAISLTTATIASFLPTLLLGPFAGVWVDRFNRRTVMMAADGFVALTSVLLAVVFLKTQTPPLWLIYSILFLRGVGSTFHMPAMQAAMPLLVPGKMLEKAGGWSNLVASLSNMLGPVIGAALMGLFPISAIMLVDIFGAVFAVVCLAFVKIADVPQSAQKRTVVTDLRQGFGALRGNKPLMAVFFPMIISNLVFMPMGALYPLLVRTHFMGGVWHNSAAEFVFATGLLVSSLLLGFLGCMKRRFLMISMAMGGMGLACALSGILPPSAFWLFLVMCFFMGATGTFVNVPLMAYTQQTISPAMLGKVISLLMTASTVAMPLGLLIAGPISEAVGVDTYFLWSGIASIATGVYCWLSTRRYDKPNQRLTQ